MPRHLILPLLLACQQTEDPAPVDAGFQLSYTSSAYLPRPLDMPYLLTIMIIDRMGTCRAITAWPEPPLGEQLDR